MLAIKAIDVVVVELLSSFFRGEMYDAKRMSEYAGDRAKAGSCKRGRIGPSTSFSVPSVLAAIV